MNNSFVLREIGVPSQDSGAKLLDSNPLLDDVVTSFQKIRDLGDYLAVNDGDKFFGSRYDMMTYNNHFQGIQRLYKKNWLIISGGDPEAGSHAWPRERFTNIWYGKTLVLGK